MEELNQETVDILDKILKILLEKGIVQPSDLPPLNNDSISKTTVGIVNDYSYYISLIKDYDVADVNIYMGNGFQVRPYEIKTQQFFNKGGFNLLLNQHSLTEERENEIAEIEYKKLKWDAAISKFQSNTKWWPLIISIISILISIYLLFQSIND